MQKTIKQVFVSGATLAIAFVFLWGIMVAWAAWSEPSQSPPNGNVAAPINSGDLDQVKTGRISARDVWSADATSWMTDIMKLDLFALRSNSPQWLNNYTILDLSADIPPTIANLPWTAGGLSILPSGVTPATASRVKAIVARVQCNLGALLVSTGTIAPHLNSTGPYDWQNRICQTDGGTDEYDTNDVIIPIYITPGVQGFRFNYRFDQYDHGNRHGTARLIVKGFYYK